MKILSKNIISKLSSSESKKLAELEKKLDKLKKAMIKYQSEYTIAIRKNTVSGKELTKMADKGFKYEKLVFDSIDKLEKYKELLKKKYF